MEWNRRLTPNEKALEARITELEVEVERLRERSSGPDAHAQWKLSQQDRRPVQRFNYPRHIKEGKDG